MKKINFLWFFVFLSSLFGQSSFFVPSGFTLVTSAPSGACVPGPGQFDITNGHSYACQSLTWADITGGGAGAGVASLTGDGTIFNNSASTGAVTLTLANTVTGTGGVVLATGPTLSAPILGTPASGIITNLTGTCAACTANSATSATSATTAANLSGGSTVTGTPAASVAAIQTNAALFTGGNGTTTFPYLLLQPSGATAETGWNTSGTWLGVNAASGFAGSFLDLHVNNAASVYKVAASGATSALSYGLLSTASNFGTTGITTTALLQTAASAYGGTCAMSTGTTCTITLSKNYTTPVCIVTQQSATLTGGAAGCTVSGTTVTVTAAVANSETWGALVFGNPN